MLVTVPSASAITAVIAALLKKIFGMSVSEARLKPIPSLVDAIRGYEQNQLVSDNGILSSVEVRIPLTSDSRVLQLAPFFEIGTAWNNLDIEPDPATIASFGVGWRWLINPNLSLRLDYCIPLIPVSDRKNSLQENGLYFSLRYQPF